MTMMEGRELPVLLVTLRDEGVTPISFRFCYL